jgi:N-acetylmuramoyl-L-alanine amidase
LYLNGEEVTNRTIEGFFFVFVPLETGENEFVFSQEGQEDVIRLITRNTPDGGGGGGTTPVTVTEVTALRYATIVTDEAWLFPSNTTTGGSDWLLSQGQQDRIVAESSNNFVKLSSGAWVIDSNITQHTESASIVNILKNGVYRSGADLDMLVWQSDIFPVVNPGFDGNVLTISFGMQTELPPLNMPDSLSQTVFSSYSSGIADGVPYYSFILRNDVNFEGYYTEHINGEFRFNLKKRKTLSQGDRPLTGISIILDPGHGGEYTGAIGPLGLALPEKYLAMINTLKLAERLEALGADVHLTRDTDVTVSLQDRVNLSYQIKPDLFVSLHINSVAETLNARNIRGFTVWYRNPNSIDAAQSMLDVLHYINPATNRHRGLVQSNLFVCRPSWVPSVLLEAGFIINIDDFVWMIDPVNQDKMADATVQAILEYFAG